ncbi:MAG TPA: BON domain-containing protein, partial [Myxococcota bacterium]
AIEQRLEASERLGEADFDVEVQNGVARLSGSVPSQGDKLAALTVARSTQGVRRVIDDLRVEPPVGAPPAERAP